MTPPTVTQTPLLTLTNADGSEYVMYAAWPKQIEFHTCPAKFCILEGSRGTGKSLAIRMDAHMRALSHPGFRYLIIRRTMPELKKSHLKFVGSEMAALGGSWHGTDYIATYPNGSVGYYSYCDNPEDKHKLLSSEFGAIYFDEITTFEWEWIIEIAACARAKEGAGYTPVIRGGTNPVGIGADEIHRYFITKDVSPYDDPTYNPADFVAIKTLPEDNPSLDWVEYRRTLERLPEHLRRAWLDGEWIREGMYFSDFRPSIDGRPHHVVATAPTVQGERFIDVPWVRIYRTVDWGFYPDPACCLWIAMYPNGAGVVFKERTWLRKTAEFVAKEIRQESEGMLVAETFCDPTMWSNQAATGHSIGDLFEMNGVPLTLSKNDRAAAGFAIHEWLNTIVDNHGPKIQMIKSECPMLIKTLPTLRIDKHDSKKIADGNDHWTIALAYFCMAGVGASHEFYNSAVPRWMRKKPRSTRVLGSESVRSRSLSA